MARTKGSKNKNGEEQEETSQEYATKDDMNKLTEVLTQIAETVNNLKNFNTEIKANPIVIEKTVQEIPGTADMSNIKETTTIIKPTDEEIAAGIEKMPIPPAWRKIVDEILGMDFGIDVVYPQSGSGFLFKIIVPEEKSNASQSYKEFYKVDIRTKALSYSDGIDGIRKFCELVKTNLSKKQ